MTDRRPQNRRASIDWRKIQPNSDNAYEWVRALSIKNPYAKSVLLAITYYADVNGSCFVGQKTLAEDTDLSVSTIRRRLRWLEAIGVIARSENHINRWGQRRNIAIGKRTTDTIRLRFESDLNEIQKMARTIDYRDQA